MAKRSMVMVRKVYLSIAIFTLIASLFWVGYSVYQAVNKAESVVVDQVVKTPITPTLDEKTLEKIRSREQLSAAIYDPEAIGASSKVASESGTVEEVEVLVVEEAPNPEDATLDTATDTTIDTASP